MDDLRGMRRIQRRGELLKHVGRALDAQARHRHELIVEAAAIEPFHGDVRDAVGGAPGIEDPT
jgi:hypothetical protein